ncbi:MAG: alpha-L-fucosidase [Kiritimatiellales bacterium]|nr:alpha-L-fucosidase [Kiritimatiellales bacterium]
MKYIAAVLLATIVVFGMAVSVDAMGGKASVKVYEPTWESLATHEVPEWLQDAKFGIYAHWGLYSIPAFGNEWYAMRMYDGATKNKLGKEIYEHHLKKYGGPAKFGYKEFAPMFKAEKYDPARWADLIAKSGARYAGIAVVHHDGFGLWDSDVNTWNAGKMGPKRDLYGELVTELRKKNDMRIIATFHHIRTFDWYLPTSEKEIERGRKEGWDLFDPANKEMYWNRYIGTYEEFMAQWQAKVREVVDKYQPDLLWFDGGKFQEDGAIGDVQEILAYYLNRAEQWGKPVEVLNKLPSSMLFNFPENFGMLTYEEGRDRGPVVERPWVDDMKISVFSWGYVEGQEYKPADEIVDGLIDRVSRGGGLLLSLCPKADGSLTPEQEKALVEMGAWLKTNDEAIFGTRPWRIHAEGPSPEERIVRSKKGKHPSWIFDQCDGKDIRFTMNGNHLYAITLGWPEGGKLDIKTLKMKTKVGEAGIKSISLLGCGDQVQWTRDDSGMHITMPKVNKDGLAYAFKIEPKGALVK